MELNTKKNMCSSFLNRVLPVKFVESKYKKAFLAGHDLLFSSSDYSQIKSAIQDILKDVDSGKISIDRLNESLYKIVKFKEKYSLLKL